MYAYHHSHLKEYRDPFGAVPVGGTLRLRLDVYEPESGLNCMVRIWHDAEGARMIPMRLISWGDKAVYEAEFKVPDEPTLMWYSFVLEKLPTRLFYGNNDALMGGAGANVSSSPKGYQVTVYEPHEAPSWYREGIAYQIFPDRFRRGADWLSCQEAALCPGKKGPKRILKLDWSDYPMYERSANGSIARWDFFGGTLSGIREKLLYLKSLGVSAIYLNPIFLASSNHKYDTADYMRVDPGFGDDESLKALIDEAGRFDIHIILDGVFSHTGADSIYFDALGNYKDDERGPGACDSKESPYYPWYSFKNYPADYESWWGVKDLPNVDELNPSFLKLITGSEGVLRHYMEMGIKGWRLDVADELPDKFIEKVRETMTDFDPDSLLLGEVWEDASNKISYGVRRKYLLGKELMSVMNYPFRDALLSFFLNRIDSSRLGALMLRQMENYPPEAWYAGLNLISSHDRERALTLLGEAPEAETLTENEKMSYRLPADKRALGIRRLKAMSFLQFTLPGVPCIYYGDEAGLEGYRDPYNRRTYPWGSEDGDLLHHYRVVTTLRKQHPSLKRGSVRVLNSDIEARRLPEDVFGFERECGDERLTILVNRSSEAKVKVTIEASPLMLELLGASWHEASDGLLELSLPPLSMAAYKHFSRKPDSFKLKRSLGVLAHLSAIDDPYGFVDFLKASGVSLWQVLPITPVGFGGSPYQSPGAFAGETGFVSRDTAGDPGAFKAFCEEESYWLDDYALFKAIKEAHPEAWQDWPTEERDRTDIETLMTRYGAGVMREKEAQFRFWTWWEGLISYAHERGIGIIGDMPLGMSEDSADVWAHRELFELDTDSRAALTAGVPPDYFNADGQNWGTPVYNWERLRETGYEWWIKRMEHAFKTFDILRLDHFRGFSEYFSIPRGMDAAAGGWREGPGKGFFDALKEALGGPLPIIAEDLGNLDPGVYDLLAETGFPGMDVYQFEEAKMLSASEADAANRIYYSSTHDSSTLLGWCLKEYPEEDASDKAAEIIKWLLNSHAPLVVLSVQDILGLGDDARFNTPGTVSEDNWSWRIPEGALTTELSARLKAAASSASRGT